MSLHKKENHIVIIQFMTNISEKKLKCCDNYFCCLKVNRFAFYTFFIYFHISSYLRYYSFQFEICDKLIIYLDYYIIL